MHLTSDNTISDDNEECPLLIQKEVVYLPNYFEINDNPTISSMSDSIINIIIYSKSSETISSLGGDNTTKLNSNALFVSEDRLKNLERIEDKIEQIKTIILSQPNEPKYYLCDEVMAQKKKVSDIEEELVLVPISVYDRLKEKESMWDNILNTFKKKRLAFNSQVSKRLISIVLAFASMLSWIVFTRVFVLLLQVFYEQLKIPSIHDAIAKMSPGVTSLSNIVSHNIAEMLMIVRHKLKDLPLFLAIDAANKKGIHHMVKIIAFWDFVEDDVFLYELEQ